MTKFRLPVLPPTSRGQDAEMDGEDIERSLHRRWRFLASVGGGVLDYESHGLVSVGGTPTANPFDGDGTGLLLRGRGEWFSSRHIGAGVDFQWLDGSSLDSAGVGDADFTSLDLFIHGSFRATYDDDFRAPVRMGFWLNQSDFEESLSGVQFETDRTAVGVRLAAEPEWVVSWSPEREWSVFGEVAVSVGPVDGDTTDFTPSVSFDSWASLLQADVGARFRTGKLILSAGFNWRLYDAGRVEVVTGTSPLQTTVGLDWDYFGGFFEIGTAF
ncbi:MAG: hypothetical protein AAF628_03905 [Planctomycetota bacterium]